MGEQISQINKELNNGKVKISNLDNLLKKSLSKLVNISKIWGSSELAEKRALHKSIFPGGIYYDAQNHEYLTRETNKFIELVSCISTSLEQKESGIPQENIEKSRSVAGSGVEPETFGL